MATKKKECGFTNSNLKGGASMSYREKVILILNDVLHRMIGCNYIGHFQFDGVTSELEHLWEEERGEELLKLVREILERRLGYIGNERIECILVRLKMYLDAGVENYKGEY